MTRKDIERYLESRAFAAGLAGGGLSDDDRLFTAGAVPLSPGAGGQARSDERDPPSDRRAHALEPADLRPGDVVYGVRHAAHRRAFATRRARRFQDKEGVPLSFLPFVAEAAVAALREFPIFNASVVGDQIALRKHVHLAVATSLEEGLVAPVVRRADESSFIGLARAIHELTEKARRGDLEAADVSGASFTITSPGMFGGMMGTPMIPQPQVAILGLGSVSKKPVVVDDAIAIRPIMILALSFDHRVIDGATAFQFLERIRGLLENADLPDV